MYQYVVSKVPKDCQDVYTRGFRTSGVYKISPDGVTKINVYCEQELDGGRWTVGWHLFTYTVIIDNCSLTL